MNARVAKKSISIALGAVLLLACLLSAAFVVLHAGHDHSCAEDHCMVCCALERAQSALRGMGAARLASLLLPAVALFVFGTCVWAEVCVAATPVARKIRMNH